MNLCFMRISRHKRTWRPKVEEIKYRANISIKAPEVRVIDEEGTQAGIMKTADAIAFAETRGYDLVEVHPKAEPPIAKLLDYGHFKYEKEKEARKQKAHAHKVEVKEIRISYRLGDHDREVRRTKGLKFLEEGNKVQVVMILRGREKQHANLAQEGVEEFAKSLNIEKHPTKIEQPFQRQGSRLTITVARA